MVLRSCRWTRNVCAGAVGIVKTPASPGAEPEDELERKSCSSQKGRKCGARWSSESNAEYTGAVGATSSSEQTGWLRADAVRDLTDKLVAKGAKGSRKP